MREPPVCIITSQMMAKKPTQGLTLEMRLDEVMFKPGDSVDVHVEEGGPLQTMFVDRFVVSWQDPKLVTVYLLESL